MSQKLLSTMGVLLLFGGCALPTSQPVTRVELPPGQADSLPKPVFVRQVPLIVLHSEAMLQLLVKGRKAALQSPDDFILQSRRLEKALTLANSDWVFVGYGVTVPGLGWDNYRNQDMHGKTVIMLAGAPAIPDGTEVSSRAILNRPVAPNLGNWHAKFDNAQRHGAALAIILHDAKAEGFGYDRLSEFRDTVMPTTAGEGSDSLMAFGWMPEARAAQWLKRAGVKFETLKRKADMANFSPIVLPVQSFLQMTNRWHEIDITVPQ